MTTEKNTSATDYPRRWIFDKGDQGKDGWIDGSIADGNFVRFEQGRTDYGLKPIAILVIDGAERSIWLLHDALYNRFRDELQRRSIPKLVPGEQVVIEKLQEKVRSRNDRDYVAYRVLFPDAPAPDETDLFKLEPPRTPPGTTEPEAETETAQQSAGDEDIPF